MAEEADVVIVGSRLAGACAAAHLARAGRKVVALDRSRFPSDQLSTHLLFPSGINELRLMGALEGILAHNPVQSRWLAMHAGDGICVRERWRPVGPIDYSMCVPRILQDVELVKTARAAGADIRERHRLIDVMWRGGRAVGVRYADPDGATHELHAKLVLGADGRRSSVAAAVGAFKPYRASRNGRGLIFRYGDDAQVDAQDGQTICTWRDGTSFAFVFPSAPKGRALMLFMGAADEVEQARRDPEAYWRAKLHRHPGMARRVAGMTNLTKLRSTGDTSAYFRASSGPGWALIGDAGHFKDPAIGQGQRDALWSGRTVSQSAIPFLGDPAALDRALRRWEHERDQECLHSYHFANLETRVEPVSPVLMEILRRTSRTSSPDVSDLFGRARTLPQVLTIPRMLRGLADELRTHNSGQPPAAVIKDALQELRIHLSVRHELLGRRFRSTQLVPGSDHPNPEPPVYRATSQPVEQPASRKASPSPRRRRVAVAIATTEERSA